MLKEDKKKNSSIILQNAVNWLKASGQLEDIPNGKIAHMMGYSATTFSSVWSGKEEAQPRFIKSFEDTFLKQHNYRWELFKNGMPENDESEKAYIRAIKEVYGDLIKGLHDKVDNLTALVQELKITIKKR